MQALTGRNLGHYQVVEKIGAGRMGVGDLVMIMVTNLRVRPPTG